MIERVESVAEEVASSISHGVGLLASLVALPVLVAVTVKRHDAWLVTGVSIFGATLVLLYLASTLYHAFPPSRAKKVFRLLDHSAIYLLIAGTYTPFALGPLRGPWGVVLLSIVWGLAVSGICVKAVLGVRASWLSTVLYLAMGWMGLVAAKPLFEQLPTIGMIWLVLGGLCYSTGIIFFHSKRLPFAHFVWHLMVLAGSVFHTMAVLLAAPPLRA